MPEKSKNSFHPHTVEVTARRYAWCSCGGSKKQPFCDGSHGSTGMFPKIIEFTETKTVTFCGCKATSTPPFCDGTHAKFKD
jgi:CDGSH-type Zn-finger protein